MGHRSDYTETRPYPKVPSFLLATLKMLVDLVVPLMIFTIGLALSLSSVHHEYIIIPAVLIKLFLVPSISCASAFCWGLGDLFPTPAS